VKKVVTVCLIITVLFVFSGCGFYYCTGGSEDTGTQLRSMQRGINRIEDKIDTIMQDGVKVKPAEKGKGPC